MSTATRKALPEVTRMSFPSGIPLKMEPTHHPRREPEWLSWQKDSGRPSSANVSARNVSIKTPFILEDRGDKDDNGIKVHRLDRQRHFQPHWGIVNGLRFRPRLLRAGLDGRRSA
jgi:hypothetical protein